MRDFGCDRYGRMFVVLDIVGWVLCWIVLDVCCVD